MNSKGESLSCIAGGDFSFECPCCPTELDDCTFKKHGHDKYIARRGFLNLNTKYEFNENKTHITLKRCDESDGGTYAWICGNCNDKHFDLNVHKGGLFIFRYLLAKFHTIISSCYCK